MIAPVRTPFRNVGHEHQKLFLEMLPKIQSQARRAFRRLRAEHKEELIEEVLANAYCAFARLVQRGKASLAYATPLASFAIRQVLAGRRVGTRHGQRDVTSRRAKALGIRIERLDAFDYEQGSWRAALIEDRTATPAEIAAARIDVAAWLGSLDPRNRKVAETLAMGETTSEAARRFNLSKARISQIRVLLKQSWERFQGGVHCRQSSRRS